MDNNKLRAWWSRRQGLEGDLAKASPASVLERSGWARSVAGVGPYFTLYSRAGIGRSADDAAVAKLQIHELPAARGCTYVVPAGDFALALRVGQSFNAGEMTVARKLGVTDRELARLCDAVIKAVGSKPVMPDQIREAVGAAARSLGEAGKKKGMNSTLPLALGLLQSQGEIRRAPENGRLDQQRYGYVRWSPNPLAEFKLSEEEALTELARRFFTWVGPSRLSDFQWFAGLSQKAARTAIEPLKLVVAPDAANGSHADPAVKDAWLLLPADANAWSSFKPALPGKPDVYRFVASLDAIAALRRDARTLLDPADEKKLDKDAVSGAAAFSDLNHHAILNHGRLVGFWEFDPEAGELVWAAFVPRNDKLRQAAQAVQRYIVEDLGDARSFSLDNPKSRAPRLAALRARA